MRSITALALALGLSFVFAGWARAGALGSPVGFGACGSLNVASDEMSDPNTAFTNAESVKQCEQLCKRGGNLCKTSVNDSAACYLRLAASYRSFGRTNCEIVTNNPDDERACKQSNNAWADGMVGEIKAQRSFARSDCEDWVATCQAACLAF